MTLVSIYGIAFALAMDAFAVAVASGLKLRKVGFRQYFRLSWHFGLFQAIMPVIGWFCGIKLRGYLEKIDHWLAFVMLSFIGFKMIHDALGEEEEEKKLIDPTKGSSLIILSVATSIDALAAGLSISILNVAIWVPAIIIGITACVLTAAGLFLGSKAGAMSKIDIFAEIFGGGLLILIGVNVLRDHGVFAF